MSELVQDPVAEKIRGHTDHELRQLIASAKDDKNRDESRLWTLLQKESLRRFGELAVAEDIRL
jgi:hypothetical protein